MRKLISSGLVLVCFLVIGKAYSTEDQNIYRDESKKFSVVVPKGWELHPHKEETLVLALVKRTPLKPFNPSIIVSLLDASLPMPENNKHLKLIVESISGPSEKIPNIENFKVIGSAIDTKKGDAAFLYRAVYELKRVKNEKDRKVSTLNYIYREEDRFVALSLVAPTADYKVYEKSFWPVLASLSFSD